LDEHEDPIRQLFTRHGLRCTRQRRLIYQALAATKSHPSADELYQQISPQDRRLSLATVYNALDAFCAAGMAIRLPSHVNSGGSPSARYDANVNDHLHARCENSGAVVDVPEHLSQQVMAHLSPELLEQIESELGFKVNRVHIELLGQYQRFNGQGMHI